MSLISIEQNTTGWKERESEQSIIIINSSYYVYI